MWNKSIINGWEANSPKEVCPICGYDCCHIIDVRRDTGLSSAKYGNVVIVFWGECDHYWAKILSDHKGTVFIDTAEIKVGAHLINNTDD